MLINYTKSHARHEMLTRIDLINRKGEDTELVNN